MKVELVLASAAFLAIFTLTHSPYIAIAIALLVVGMGWIQKQTRVARLTHLQSEAWPEVLDHLMSGIQSGMSLTESFTGLVDRGPVSIRPVFHELKRELYTDGNFERVLILAKARFATSTSDQIFEALMMARKLGGSELLQVLRSLSEYLREELATRREIEVKHGWIKNSAHLSSVAPWLLLLLLATQETTAKAFATPSGVLVLAIGLVMTCAAYLWMHLLSRLPETPRVFK